ncbi:hypothetical protein ACIQWZ_12400 [Streptomyces sp. NPDC098077]|uniref:hypothetical protein n=1 Tax=Streptomyces sp. NPDC098077 TaxID=3366093 RepID=UPI003813BEBA
MDHDERQAEPTVAELRADVAQRIADAPADSHNANMLRSIVQFLDDYTAERTARSDGPKAAHYVRADASTLPTHPAGQEAAVEGMAAAHGYTQRRRGTFERIADDLNRRGVPTDTPHGKIVTEMFELFNAFERETAAARAAEGDTNPYDLEPFADVHDLAEQYEQAKTDDDPALFERFLDNLAEDLDLDDVKALRTAAAAAAEAMGRITLDARTRGMGPDRIANETGYTASRIAQFLREERERRGDDAK